MSSRTELPRDPIKARRKGRNPPNSILVSKWPGSKQKPLDAIPMATFCQNAQSLILWPHEHRYVSGFTDRAGPVISPTVAICGCELTRIENRVDPEYGIDDKNTNGTVRLIATSIQSITRTASRCRPRFRSFGSIRGRSTVHDPVRLLACWR